MMSKNTVASILLKNTMKLRLLQLTKLFDMAVCCSKCVVEAPGRPKGEYVLLGNIPIVADDLRFSGHGGCRRDGFYAKNGTNPFGIVFVQFTLPKGSIRGLHKPPFFPVTQEDGKFKLCEYYQAGKKLKCQSGEFCIDAHCALECEIWTRMTDMDLDFENMRSLILEEIGDFVTNITKQAIPNAMNGEKPVPTPPIKAVNGLKVPEDAVRPGSNYEEQGFFVYMSEKTYLTVQVTRVDGPHRFYFNLVENLDHLKQRLQILDDFYKSDQGDNYRMIDEDVMNNLPVAARIPPSDDQKWPRWRRAQIIYFTVDKRFVEILDVDSGEEYSVGLDDLRLLRAEYFVLQKQAIEGAIGYVRPSKDGQWSWEAIELVRTFCKKGPLIAELVGVTDDRLGFILCNTSDPSKDEYLADMLIERGYAIVCKTIKSLQSFRTELFKDQ